MLKPLVVASNPTHDGQGIQVSTERLGYSNAREYHIDFGRRLGGGAVGACDDSRRVCVVRQYRHGVQDFLWEIPAGKLDVGEPPEVCALRELKEETGVEATRWTSLGRYIPAPGIFTEVIHLYLARDLEIGAASPDADEELELKWLPLDEAIDLVLRGEWNDGKTCMALLRTQFQLQM